jgi:UDP-2,3-diacylglucosamine pyrophosphatase LpxH
MLDFKPFPEFDEVHVISDLHMGGVSGFQILRETARLAAYIAWVGRQSPSGRVALVLNGDVFDSLAEEVSDYVAMTEAVRIVQRIVDDPAFSGVWQALAAFVGLPGRTLVFNIGNHDIEMAFATVQHFLLWRLCGDDAQKRAAVMFSTSGAGFSCEVGQARVYCTHGNEVDAWNFNRYEDLAKVSRCLNAGQTLAPDAWHANAGTRMVKEVMNEIKKKYKWIDLLKPETRAALGTLAALDPSQVAKIPDLLSIVAEKTLAETQVEQRLAGGAESQVKPKFSETLAADLQAAKGLSELLIPRLSAGVSGFDKAEALRRALHDWLAGDRTFDLEFQDTAFLEVMKTVGEDIDFLVTGHTHFARAIALDKQRFYFNCGTWIRLLRFTETMLQDSRHFAPVYELLVKNQGEMGLLDAAKFPDAQGRLRDFVLDQTTAVVIKRLGGQVVGRLLQVQGDGSGEPQVMAAFVK